MSHRQGSFVAAGHFRESGEAQVKDLHRSGLVLQQVARLYVTVYESRLVSMFEPQCRLPTKLGGILKTERPILFHDLMKTSSFDILHHQEVDFLILLDLFVDVVSSHNVGVVERRDGLSLAKKSRQIGRVVDLLNWQNFDGTSPSHQRVFGEVDGTHAAFAKQLAQAVLAQAESFVFAPLQLIDLPAGEVVVVDQPRTDRRGILHVDSGTLHLPHQRLDTIPLKQVALLKHIQKGVGSEFRHEVFWGRTDRSQRISTNGTLNDGHNLNARSRLLDPPRSELVEFRLLTLCRAQHKDQSSVVRRRGRQT